MNQILSVEMSKNNSNRKSKGSSKKASIKSVIIFFCIILLVFGGTITALGIYSKMKEDDNNNSEVKQPTEISGTKPRIDITQNASELNVEVSAENEISKIEYSWNNGETKELTGNGTNQLDVNIEIPNGTNTFNIVVTDINGTTNEYSNEYVGPEIGSGTGTDNPSGNDTSTINLEGQEGNKLKISCTSENIIAYVAYYFDQETEQQQTVNSTTAQIEVPIDAIEGGQEHTLTVRLVGSDGNEINKISKSIYIPKVEVKTDGNNFIINASDSRGITKVYITFNDGEQQEIDVNDTTYENTLVLQTGENRIILTVYNSDGISVTKKVRWEKK